MAQDNIAIVKEIYDCYNRRDFKATSKLIDNNAEFLNVPSNVTFKGPEGLQQILEGWRKGFPDSKITINNIVGSGDMVICEFTGAGSHTGPFMTPDGEFMPTNKKLSLSICEVTRLKNGKVINVRTYYDTGTIMKSLGIMPELKHS